MATKTQARTQHFRSFTSPYPEWSDPLLYLDQDGDGDWRVTLSSVRTDADGYRASYEDYSVWAVANRAVAHFRDFSEASAMELLAEWATD